MEGLLGKLIISLTATVLVLSGTPLPNNQKIYQPKVVKKVFKKLPKYSPKSSNQKLKNIISEIERIGNMFIGSDHYDRLEKAIKELADSGSVDKKEIDQVKKMISKLNYDRGNMKEKKSATEQKRDDIKFALRDKFINLEREVKQIIDNKIAIGPDHFARLKQQLDELYVSDSFGEEELARLKQLLTFIRYFEKESGIMQYAGSENCKNIKELILTHDITDFSKVRSIGAPGADGGPKDKYKGHSFINTDHQRVSVYAPVEIVLESGSHYVGVEGVPQYILNFRVKDFCKVLLRFDHVTEPVESIRRVLSATPKPFEDTTSDLVSEEITFKAGERIGYTTGTPPPNGAGNWDFGLYDMSKPGSLAAMGAYGQHAHAVCSWDFYPPEKRDVYKKMMDGRKFVCDF